jgi:hypothetical protein
MMNRVALALCLFALLTLHAGGAAAETSRLIHVHDADGAHFQTERGPDSPALAAAPLALRDELIWQHNIAGFMYTSCATVDGRVFAGLNNGASCPAEYHLEDWDGLPDWTFSGGENYVTAGAGYLALVEALPAIAGVRLHVWMEGDPPTPLWEKDIPNCSAPLNCLRIAEAGNLLALAVNTAASSKTFALDPLTGDLLSSYTAPAGEFARALRVTDDGSRIALRNGAVMHALDAATGALLWTASAGASSDALAISPDGQYIAAGWISLLVWEWNGSSYQPKWSHNSGSAGWYLGTCALSGSGQLIAGWYTTSYNRNKVTWYDTPSGNTPLWTYLTPTSNGVYQDLPVASAFGGEAGVIGSWGDAQNLNPEISVFLSSASMPLYTVNTVGSIYDVDAEGYSVPGGRYPAFFVGGGKHVHANEFGSGGDLYFGEVSPATAAPALPGAGFALSAQPNPSRGESTLSLSLPRAGAAQVDLFGVDGRHLRRLLAGPQAAGELRLAWDGRDSEGRALPSGVYLARATASGRAATLRLVLMR